MKLTGEQVAKIHDISDGAVVILSKRKGSPNVKVIRREDDLKLTIASDGSILGDEEDRNE